MKINVALISLFALFVMSCSKDHKLEDKDLSGIWTVKKVVCYLNGKEVTSFPAKDGDGGYAGSTTNPALLKFTKYGELVFSGGLYKSNGDMVYQYKVKGDSIYLPPYSPMLIKKVSTDTLVTVNENKVDYYDKSAPHGKWILTFYYTR
ncbi:hypothetical protein [Hymenobacter baengnokdamensis]|uniref:hypothetical protein n=1 Tax=Hymenobacter baengnokdamensis TaxID=2615203 RepID=UPI0012477A75|nr:hypothetical protein [Hymenobacter baengnokdamensis]